MFDRSFSLNPYIVKIRDFDLTSFYNKYGKILNDLKSVASNHQATIIDPIQTLCSKNSCKTVDANGIPIYCDDNHFTKKHVSSSINYLDFIFI
jgi:hypothetical protein